MGAVTLERQEAIERYVIVEALGTFVEHLLQPQRDEVVVSDIWPEEMRPVMEDLEPLDISDELCRLRLELWPEDEDIESPEYEDAYRRADFLAARCFTWAAARPDAFAAEGSWIIARLAQGRMVAAA
jgi:hypothetical protein